MRLCLDEHYSPLIAFALREVGHDVISIAERFGLPGLPDFELVEMMIAKRRAILTENAADFMPVVARLALEARDHYGLLLSSHASLPRSRNTVGRYVRSLEPIMAAHPREDDLLNRIVWLAAGE